METPGIKGVLDAEMQLRTAKGTNDPKFLSEQMMRLTQYLSAVEEQLAKLEETYEVDMSQALRTYQVDQKLSASAAENMARIDLGMTRGRIAFLTRIVGSGWKIVGACQSRYKHLENEYGIAGKHVI